MKSLMNNWITWLVAVAIAMAGLWYMSDKANAADLGGNCCADLEERIAELEATVAKKGNRKVSLTVYGQVSRSVTYWDDLDGSYSKTENGVVVDSGKGTLLHSGKKVGIDNSLAESRFGFAGSAKINPEWMVGYVLEVGVGKAPAVGFWSEGDLNVRKSYLYVKSAKLGAVSLGKASTAMDDIDKISTANVDVATRPLSLRPVTAGGEIWDGTKANLIRYDSPMIAGFMASASWSQNDSGLLGEDESTDAWELALRYAGEFDQFKVVGGIGYGQSELKGDGIAMIDREAEKIEGTLSIMHIPSGIFVTGNYGWAEFSGDSLPATIEAKGYAGMVGVSTKPFAAGDTTIYGEYGMMEGNIELGGKTILGATVVGDPDAEVTYYGAGLVQEFDKAAFEMFAAFRVYEAEADAAWTSGGDDHKLHGELDNWFVGSVGARIKF